MREIGRGNFRSDLYYRLCGVPLTLPPLRERRTDIPQLVRHVISITAKEQKRDIPRISQKALDVLQQYSWPGNVRELQNWIQYALIKCQGFQIEPEHLPPVYTIHAPISFSSHRRRKLVKEQVIGALKQTGNNKKQAARLLNVGRATLYRFLAEHPDI